MVNLKIPMFMALCMVAAVGGCERRQKAPKQDAVEPGDELIQSQPPLRAISTYLDGVHFYNGDMEEQIETHHYVTILNDDVMQAVLFDGNGANARMIGIEYIISAELFEQLPEQEKQLWHSHGYEVKSGLLIAPGLDPAAEHELMEILAPTYGKTWHTWHTHRDENVPRGIPQLMMAFTADGQIDPELLSARERRYGIDAAELAARRADIPMPQVDPQADAWTRGDVIQLEAVNLEDE